MKIQVTWNETALRRAVIDVEPADVQAWMATVGHFDGVEMGPGHIRGYIEDAAWPDFDWVRALNLLEHTTEIEVISASLPDDAIKVLEP
jgi:hypothetical protein